MDIKIMEKALSNIGDVYVNEAITYRKNRRQKICRIIATIACCLTVVVGGMDIVNRFGFFRAGCSANPGTIIDGVYYYSDDYGICSYSIEEGKEKLISEYWYDEYGVNDYGIYYRRGRALFVREHETGKERRLYKSGFWSSTHISFNLQQDGNVIVRIYNKYKETVAEVLVDGISGEVIETVMETRHWNWDWDYYSDTHFVVGDRLIELAPIEGGDTVDLLVDGESILPEGYGVYSWMPEYINGDLYFQSTHNLTYFVVRTNGNDEFVKLPDDTFNFTGNEDYFFWVRYFESGNEIWCYSVATGEKWKVELDEDMEQYAIATDGEYMYTCVPWNEYQALWEIVYDESGKPVEIELIDDDIND